MHSIRQPFLGLALTVFLLNFTPSPAARAADDTQGSKLTKENADKIRTGLTVAEVEEILGKGTPITAADIQPVTRAQALMQRTLATGGTGLRWQEGRKMIIVIFRGGKVTGTSTRNLDSGGGAAAGAGGKEMTREEVAKVLEDVKGADKDRRKGACERLAKAQPGEGRKEVVETLTPLLTDPDLFTRAAALKAHVAWADKDAVATYYDLLKADKDFVTRAILIEALARLDGARAAEAIAARLTDGADRGAATKALKAIGPDAEKAVHPYLANPDFITRTAACQVLEQIGTAASIEALKKAADGLDGVLAPGVNRAAEKAIAAINARK